MSPARAQPLASMQRQKRLPSENPRGSTWLRLPKPLQTHSVSVCWIKREKEVMRKESRGPAAAPEPCTFLFDQVLQVLPLDVKGDVGDEGSVSFGRRAGVRLKAAPSSPLGIPFFPFLALAGPVAFTATRKGRGPSQTPPQKPGPTLTLEA